MHKITYSQQSIQRAKQIKKKQKVICDRLYYTTKCIITHSYTVVYGKIGIEGRGGDGGGGDGGYYFQRNCTAHHTHSKSNARRTFMQIDRFSKICVALSVPKWFHSNETKKKREKTLKKTHQRLSLFFIEFNTLEKSIEILVWSCHTHTHIEPKKCAA